MRVYIVEDGCRQACIAQQGCTVYDGAKRQWTHTKKETQSAEVRRGELVAGHEHVRYNLHILFKLVTLEHYLQ